jgi:hypothetical protein
MGRKMQVQQLLTQHLNLMHEVYSTLLQQDLYVGASMLRHVVVHATAPRAAADLARRAEQPLGAHAEASHRAEVAKLKEEIQQRLQQQVLALRRVVADVESSASVAAVSSVKLHNKNRSRGAHGASAARPTLAQVSREGGGNYQAVEQRAGDELHLGAHAGP